MSKLFATPWIASQQTSLSITNSRSSLKLTSIELVMPSSHLFFCHPLFLLLSRLVITFLPRSKRLLISWLQSPSAVILEPRKMKSDTVSAVSPSICHEVMGPDAMIFVFWMLSFKPTFSLSSFTFIKRLFNSSSLSAIRVVSSAYLRLLIFLPGSVTISKSVKFSELVDLWRMSGDVKSEFLFSEDCLDTWSKRTWLHTVFSQYFWYSQVSFCSMACRIFLNQGLNPCPLH